MVEDVRQIFIALELGGTTCRVAFFACKQVDAKPLSFHLVPTTEPEETLENLRKIMKENIKEGEEYATLGIASFGPLCLDRKSELYGHITSTPKPKWANTPIVSFFKESDIGQRSGDFSTSFETDVNAAALLEFNHGQHEGVDQSVAYITVGTGIGIGLVFNSLPIHGLVHGEGGHMRI